MNQPGRWLALAAVLLGVVAALVPEGRPGEHPPDGFARREIRHEPAFAERQRMISRRTLPPAPRSSEAAQNDLQMRDPLLTALPERGHALVVFEASVFGDLPIGRMLVRCMGAGGRELESDLDRGGFERVAFAQLDDGRGLMAVEGDFREGLPDGRRAGTPYGDRAQVFAPPVSSADAGPGPRARRHEFSALWNGELWLSGDNADDLRQAIDRLEGRGFARQAIDGNQAYGESYGYLDAEMIKRLLPRKLAQGIMDESMRIEFHVSGRDDIDLAIDASGKVESTQDLGKAVAGALAMMRMKAVEDGDTRLARLLDLYAVRNVDTGFQLEAALTADFLVENFASCARGADSDAGAPPIE